MSGVPWRWEAILAGNVYTYNKTFVTLLHTINMSSFIAFNKWCICPIFTPKFFGYRWLAFRNLSISGLTKVQPLSAPLWISCTGVFAVSETSWCPFGIPKSVETLVSVTSGGLSQLALSVAKLGPLRSHTTGLLGFQCPYSPYKHIPITIKMWRYSYWFSVQFPAGSLHDGWGGSGGPPQSSQKFLMLFIPQIPIFLWRYQATLVSWDLLC